MRILSLSCLVALLFCTACASKFNYVPLSDFAINQHALRNHDTVEVIYATGGPDLNADKQYYYMYIAVSKSTGDTVRILSLFRYDFASDARPRKVFISRTSQDAADKAILKQLGDASPQKVVHNKAIPPIPNSEYPTVIGLMAEVK